MTAPLASTWFTGATVNDALIDTNQTAYIQQALDQSADDGLVSTGGAVTLAANWNTLVFHYRIRAGMVTLTISATRSGSTLTAGSSGGLTDTDVVTVASPLVPNDSNVYGVFVGPNTSGGCVLDTSGKWTLLDAHPTSTIASGDTVHATFVYPAA